MESVGGVDGMDEFAKRLAMQHAKLRTIRVADGAYSPNPIKFYRLKFRDMNADSSVQSMIHSSMFRSLSVRSTSYLIDRLIKPNRSSQSPLSSS